MAKRSWTEEQRSAINTRGKTLLVSAAAGSGKTATLTERIIRTVLDDEHPADIRRMLIVTFTNAAVGELRQRIGEAIKNACIENPGNARLEEQLLAIKDAKIQTIDSFCNYIVKLYPEQVGLPPNFRIAEEAEVQLLASEIMDRLIYSAYEGELADVCSGEKFAYVAECLTSTREERELKEVFKLIYESFESLSGGILNLYPMIQEFNPEKIESVSVSKYGRYITEEVKGALMEYSALYNMRYDFEEGSSMERRGFEVFDADAKIIDACLLAEGFDSLKDSVCSAEFRRLPGGKGERGESYLYLGEIRKCLKADFEEFSSKYFTYSEKDFLELYVNLYESLGAVYRFLKKFDDIYTAEKQRRGICNYADLEKYALRILTDNSGGASDVAAQIRECFDSIYIDEYQDVNRLQAEIFDCISKPTNRFMVGDIKQSIYGFRAARPEIFASMKESFPKLGEDEDSDSAALFMSSNFRCDEAIIDFVNGIFDKEFSTFRESISYTDSDRLKFAKIYDGAVPSGDIPEVHILPGSSRRRKGEVEVEDGDSEENPSAPLAVAKKIDSILNSAKSNSGSPYSPSDIAIILRSNQGKAEQYAEALRSCGIKASIPGEGDFFLNEEILLALSMLTAIDNPRKDVYLSAIMRSPIFGFTADELTLIRLESRADCLFAALTEYVENHPSFSKGRAFLARLKKYRELSESMGADRLLSLIYKETGMLSLESGRGRDNLILLLNYAAKHEETSEDGLYGFISYINAVIDSGRKFTTPGTESDTDGGVRIITAHKSKGLEFPVCIFASAEGAVKRANRSRITLDTDFGISMLLKDPSGLASVENPIFNAIENYKFKKEFEEELRVLYVILTRARERLFVYGTATSDSCEAFLEKMEYKKLLRSPYFARKRRSMLEVILTSLNTGRVIIEGEEENKAERCAEDDTAERVKEEAHGEGEFANGGADASDKSYEGISLSEEELTLAKEELVSRFSFVYPRRYQMYLPEKLSVSALYPAVLDGTGAEDVKLDTAAPDTEAPDGGRPIIPDFISGRAADESARRGIATHMFLQFCDLDRLASMGAGEELRRLVELEFLSEKDGARVRLPEIEAFRNSPLFSDMRGAVRLWRELRFNVRLPADRFTENEEAKAALAEDKILVQGVIDCLIEDSEGNMHLVDYKTDRLSAHEIENPSEGEERLRRAHSLQLSYYKEAVFSMFGKYPKKTGVYSLHLGYEIEI